MQRSSNSVIAIVTFLKLTVDAVEVTWLAGYAAIALSLPKGLTFSSNDRPGRFHRKATSLCLPNFSVKVLITGGSERDIWLEAAELVGDAYLDVYMSPVGWRDSAQAQADFIQVQDELTGRARTMFEAFESEKPIHMFGRSLNAIMPNLATYHLRLPDHHVHRSGIYLPHPRLSNIPSHQKPPASPKAPTGDFMATKTNRWSARLSQLSESDGEEGVSEADRDARLA
jgi:hypothetical protein